MDAQDVTLEEFKAEVLNVIPAGIDKTPLDVITAFARNEDKRHLAWASDVLMVLETLVTEGKLYVNRDREQRLMDSYWHYGVGVTYER
jgi:hypothetical protein